MMGVRIPIAEPMLGFCNRQRTNTTEIIMGVRLRYRVMIPPAAVTVSRGFVIAADHETVG